MHVSMLKGIRLKVRFINIPPCGIYEYLSSKDKMELQYTEPLGLLYIASYLRNQGYDIDLVDLNIVVETSIHQHLRDLISICVRGDPEVIAFPTYSATFPETLLIARGIKERLTETKIVFGGPHSSFRDKETLSHKQVDFVVRKEGELTMSELVKELEKGTHVYRRILGLSYKDKQGIKRNPDRPFIKDLDALPLPARDLLSKYYYTKGLKLNILSSRGCPYQCIFCVAPKYWKRKVRFRSIDNVEKEIAQFLDDRVTSRIPKGFHLNFVDDVFALGGKKRVIAMSDMLSNFGIDWHIYSRVDTVNKEILLKLRQSNCTLIRFGIESGSQRILDLLKKGVRLEQITRAVALAKKAGFITHGSFIIGFPTETEKDVQKTIALSKKLPLDFAFFFIATPYPGTELADRYLVQGLRLNYAKIEKFNCYTNMFGEYERLSPQRKMELLSQAYESFYLEHKGLQPPRDFERLSNPLSRVSAIQNIILKEYFDRIKKS
jgi:anaerobic magnesium-protoporphyrin IX monomethyl ester cyclase